MTLFLVGGDPSPDLNDVVVAFTEQAKEFGQKILVAAREDQVAEFEYLNDQLAKAWQQAQIEPLWLTGEPVAPAQPDTPPTQPDGSPAAPTSPAAQPDSPLERPDEIAALVLADGRPAQILASLAGYREQLAQLARGAVPFLAYGAAAMTFSKYAITGGWRHQSRQIASPDFSYDIEEFTLANGLSVIGPSVETRVDQHQTLQRAITALRTGQMSSVVALDSDVCLVIDSASGRTKLLGSGTVTWLSRAGDDVYLRFEQSPEATTAESDSDMAS